MALVKTWERQLGAKVKFDMQKMIATLVLKKPQKIDFDLVARGAKKANFTVGEIRIEAGGHIVKAGNDSLKTDYVLELKGSGQIIALSGKVSEEAVSQYARIWGKVIGWPEKTAAIEVEKIRTLQKNY